VVGYDISAALFLGFGAVGMIRSGRGEGWGYGLRLMKEARRSEQFDDPSTNAVIGFGYD